jgi:DNA-binding transcriptional LysR family regulator
VWRLHAGSRTTEVRVRARLAVNDFDLLHEAALAGAGVALLGHVDCAAEVAAGRLQRLLPEWSSPGTPVHALYPSTRHHSPKVTAFLDVLRERWQPPTVRRRR